MSHLMAAVDQNTVVSIAVWSLNGIIFGWMLLILWKTRSEASRAELREKYGQQGPNPPTRGAGD